MSEPDRWPPDPRMIPEWQDRPRYDHRPGAAEASGQPQPAGKAPPDSFVRPFILTGGRTQPMQDGLRVETLVYAQPGTLFAPLQFERRRIVELCQTPCSIAEIASALQVPLGVARVLVSDLAADGLISVHQQAETPIRLIERVLDRVRAL